MQGSGTRAGRTSTGQEGGVKGGREGDSANSRSRCRELMRPTENSKEATVCYKHCPDSYVGVDIPVTKLSQSKHRTSWQPTPEPLPHLNELIQTRLPLPKDHRPRHHKDAHLINMLTSDKCYLTSN